MLMFAVEDIFKQVSRFELFTGHKSEKNIALYQKMGYRLFHQKTVNGNLTLVYMEKILTRK